MRPSTLSSIRSIFLSTGFLVAFALVQGPVWKPVAQAHAGIAVWPAVQAPLLANRLQLTAGKSLIVDSPAPIKDVTVANPDLAGTIKIDSHEVLLNGKLPGETTLTLWQEGDKKSAFEVSVEADSGKLTRALPGAGREMARADVSASYKDAMSRVQTVLTGSSR